MLRGVGLMLCLGLVSGLESRAASSIYDSEVHYSNGVYRVRMELEVAAGFDAVRAVITDYGGLERVSTLIKETTLLDSPPGEMHRYVEVEMCILFVCYDSDMVERIEEPDRQTVLTTVIPERSDFRSGHSRWDIRPLDGDRTLIRFQYTMEPDFWIPPLIGPLVVKRKLLSSAEHTIGRIEALARE